MADHMHRLKVPLAALALLVMATGCAPLPEKDGGPSEPVDLSHVREPVPKDEPPSRYGNPDSYVVFGSRYHVLDSAVGYRKRGIASWYGTKFHGRRTSSGEPFDMYRMTAAHKTLPLPTYARVTNLDNGRSITVRINDRGPFKDNRLIDLSYAAAKRLGIADAGTGLVEVEAITPGAAGSVDDPANGERPAESASSITARPEPPRLFLQAGAFSDRGNAATLKRRLERELQVPVRVDPGEHDGRTLFKVRIGPVGRVARIDRLSRRLVELGFGEAHVVVE